MWESTRGLIDVRNRRGRLDRRFKLLPLVLDGLLYTSGRMGSNQTETRSLPKAIAPRGTSRIPNLRFRVLVMGRANAGKTSILQRVCDTTESPIIYRRGEEVRSTNVVYKSDLAAHQVKLNPSMDVSDTTSIPRHLALNAVSARRAHHRR